MDTNSTDYEALKTRLRETYRNPPHHPNKSDAIFNFTIALADAHAETSVASIRQLHQMHSSDLTAEEFIEALVMVVGSPLMNFIKNYLKDDYKDEAVNYACEVLRMIITPGANLITGDSFKTKNYKGDA